ncbi:peptide-methionine (S)-S-oxide reductase MsrA [Lacimicrobium sp. SS2-24]|uniref:peptide-methionine (S)-S-oxide reductase MsrA n=1 Tax=Lacimicrobium sp. SS2-24 TaxID=2005569 RepID=UPI000B4A73CC|nr:peptide-methionine (S)-S-oxide reductase MsrA [Lacimicrobium sp. SS2-24]
MAKNLQQATLGGGCFWCLESALNALTGIESAYCGYAGGHVENPSYEQTCQGDTGHAEVVRVNFDADEISYEELLEIFFALHDPTQLNRQGNDVGPQYRSVIFYHNDNQKQQALALIESLEQQQIWPEKIVTEVTEVNNYYQAEDYHQDYFANNPQNTYCNMVVAPKLAKFRKKFADRLKASQH